MAIIDVDVARAWANERWPSPVVRRQVDDLLAHCPRAKEIPVVRCKDCKHAFPLPERYQGGWGKELMTCSLEAVRKPGEAVYLTVWADSTCDDAEERE